MVIVDEKCMYPPPPPYAFPPSIHNHPPPPFPHHRHHQIHKLDALPAHLLLEIVYMTFPQTPGIDQGRLERQRKTLYWLAVGLRLVNRAFYIACMHVLRSTYLPAYDSLIRPPYTSDPFPHSPPSYSHSYSPPSPPSPSSPSSSSSPSPSTPCPTSIKTIQRETTVLDLFIALKVREDVWMDDSELHLEREESFKDLFDLNQPRSRVEDLIRIYGVREGVVSLGPAPGLGSVGRSSNRPRQITPLPFSALSVSFSSRKVGLQLSSSGRRKRTIVEVGRGREERLEVAAKSLVRELKAWLVSGAR